MAPSTVPPQDGPAPTFGNFIGGEWRDSITGRQFVSVDPADTRQVIGRFQASDAADVAEAVRAAEVALPAWRATPAPKRGEILYAFGALLARHKERLAQAMTREMGKVLAEARGDVQEGIDIAYLMAGEGRRMFGETVPSELPDKWAMSIRQPIGVAGIITPWNFPMAIPCWKMMPALVTGNTVVLKPATDTPHCAVLLVKLMEEAGFPAGTVNLVTGSGPEVGMPLVESPDVPVISFTGSNQTGRRIAEAAARRLKRVSLELGGKNGIVVMSDADLDLAVDGILWSAFGTTGQRCTACSRVIVAEEVADRLVDELAERAAALRLGAGSDPATDVGPLINGAALERVAGYADLARDEARIVVGGAAATDRPGLEHGHFFAPTVVDGVQPMDRLGQEEIFGPLLSVIRVGGYEEAVKALNQTRYGLSSSIYTRDTNTSFRAMRDFETGIVYVNAGTIGAETHLPFGGWKGTGNGHREAGHVALDTYTEWKSIYVDYSGRLQRAQIDNQ
ncbi:MAG: aldehyde dehydrogenase family protein [Chloroflexota bacterium]|nr:aldehyde dehydrogenase family protein [Chloroflexota bacterium]